MHAEYGGVVPELASRDHIRRCPRSARFSRPRLPPGLSKAWLSPRPGAGRRVVGRRQRCQRVGLRLGGWVGIHHLKAICSPLHLDPWAIRSSRCSSPGPATHMRVDGVGRYSRWEKPWTISSARPSTRPRRSGLGYPGAAVSRAERGGPTGEAAAPELTSADLNCFSGLKTAVLLAARRQDETEAGPTSRGLQDAIVTRATKARLRSRRPVSSGWLPAEWAPTDSFARGCTYRSRRAAGSHQISRRAPQRQ